MVANELFVVGLIHEPSRRERWSQFRGELARHTFSAKTFIVFACAVGVPQLLLLMVPLLGVYANALALVALVAYAIRFEAARMAALAVAALPTATMVSLALPQATALARSGLLYGVLAALAFAYRYILRAKRQTAKLDWNGYLTISLAMIVVGQALGAMADGVLRSELMFGDISLPLIAFMLALFALAEEIFFRGLVQESVGKAINPIMAVALAAALYAFMTLPLGSLAVTTFAASSSLMLGLIYYAKPNIILTTAINMAAKILFAGLLVLCL